MIATLLFYLFIFYSISFTTIFCYFIYNLKYVNKSEIREKARIYGNKFRRYIKIKNNLNQLVTFSNIISGFFEGIDNQKEIKYIEYLNSECQTDNVLDEINIKILEENVIENIIENKNLEDKLDENFNINSTSVPNNSPNVSPDVEKVNEEKQVENIINLSNEIKNLIDLEEALNDLTETDISISQTYYKKPFIIDQSSIKTTTNKSNKSSKSKIFIKPKKEKNNDLESENNRFVETYNTSSILNRDNYDTLSIDSKSKKSKKSSKEKTASTTKIEREGNKIKIKKNI